MDIPCLYNAIFGRHLLNIFYAVLRHSFLCMKMPRPRGTIKVLGDQRWEGPRASGRSTRYILKAILEGEIRIVPLLEGKPVRNVQIAIDLPRSWKKSSSPCSENMSMSSLGPRQTSRESTAPSSNTSSMSTPARKMSTERKEATRSEVRKLLNANVIWEITYPEWLANRMLVKKSNGKCRMCVDITLLNKPYPKDNFSLACIDQIIDSTTGCERFSFLNTYSGYHQVWMAEEDQPHTSFITTDGMYCYLHMPFGLRNEGATFARLV